MIGVPGLLCVRFRRIPSHDAASQSGKALAYCDHPLLDRRKLLQVNGLNDGRGVQRTEFNEGAFKFAEHLPRLQTIVLLDEFPHLHDRNLGLFDGVIEDRSDFRLQACEIFLGRGNQPRVKNVTRPVVVGAGSGCPMTALSP